ncbi:MAG: TetR/AcrR family transcriptional regulator [Dehalococcoidia bacterium]
MTTRTDTEALFLDAAERLLLREGATAITTRRLAEEAGANHGLVHYYFGSMEQLLLRVLERFTERLTQRQRAMYEAPDLPFIAKWRTAMRFLEEDLRAGYPKIWLELQALAWNRPELRVPVARVNAEWRTVLTEAFTPALQRYGLDVPGFPIEAFVALVMTFNQGIMLERLSGISDGHAVLLAAVDRWITALEARRPT